MSKSEMGDPTSFDAKKCNTCLLRHPHTLPINKEGSWEYNKIKIDLKKFQPYNPLAKEIYINDIGEVFNADMKLIGKIGSSNTNNEGITINIKFEK